MDALVTAAHRHGVPVAVDLNFRERLWPSREAARAALAKLARRADYVFASLDDTAIGDN